jgi:hypothetical protein
MMNGSLVENSTRNKQKPRRVSAIGGALLKSALSALARVDRTFGDNLTLRTVLAGGVLWRLSAFTRSGEGLWQQEA